MSKSFSRMNAVLLAVLLCASVLPQGAVAEDGTTEHFAFGVEYDWSNMNDDFESMTGLPLDDILADVMQSADDAGIEMLILEEITGTSSMVIDQYEDGTMMLNPPDGTGSVEVTKHVTELTLRHGALMDMAMISEWSDARAGWDLTISGGSEGIVNIDAYYVEYRDVDGLIYGHDVDMSMATEQSVFFGLQGHLEAEDGESVMPLDISMEMGVDYAITNAQSEVVYSEASTLYQAMSALEGGDDLYWSIGESEDGTSPLGDGEIWDEVESHTGTFSTVTGFNFELTGLPAEEMGLPEGKWDVSASDSETDTGAFDEDFECEMGMELFEGTQMITTDGDQIEVMQAHTTPLPFGMTCHVANLFYYAFMGSEDAPTLADMVEDSVSEIVESMGGDDESSDSSDQLFLEVRAEGQDEVRINVEAWNLDSDGQYEVFLVLEDSDGNTQDATSLVVQQGTTYFWDSDYMSSSKWGEHCVIAQLKDVSSSSAAAPIDSATTCFNIAQEMDPSDLVIAIAEGFEESTLENVMENFGSNLEYRLEDYEADIAYDDGDMFFLWDNTNNMVVGFQMVVTTDSSNMWYTLVGPESDSYGDAPSPVSLTYFSGQQAIAQEADIEDDSTLEDLVDLTAHNDDIIEDAIEESLADNSPEAGGPSENSGDNTAEAADDGLLPFISPVLTITMIAIAGLVSSLRTRRD
ncbi:MAG: hypothetical protein HOM85_06100 [Euryarchaeota archaeon]|nr:hypothetical protein [Euryarchaeota archaeon]